MKLIYPLERSRYSQRFQVLNPNISDSNLLYIETLYLHQDYKLPNYFPIVKYLFWFLAYTFSNLLYYLVSCLNQILHPALQSKTKCAGVRISIFSTNALTICSSNSSSRDRYSTITHSTCPVTTKELYLNIDFPVLLIHIMDNLRRDNHVVGCSPFS